MSALLAFPNQYDSLWENVVTSRKDLEAAWLAHFKAVLSFQKSGAWKGKGFASWAEYCEAHPKELYKAGTYREFKLFAQVAEMVNENVVGTALEKSEARELSRSLAAVVEDKTLTALTWQIAYEATGDIVPSRADLQCSYEKLQEYRKEGKISLNGHDLPIEEAALTLAVMREKEERRERQLLHIENGKATTKRSVELEQREAIQMIFDYSSRGDNPSLGQFRLSWLEAKEGKE